jgi:hypothetical protein
LQEVRGEARFLGVNVKEIMKTQACPLTAAVLCAICASALAQPAVTMQPQSQTNVVGSTLTLSVEATGTPPLWYQWRKSGATMAGATNAMLVFTNLQSSHAGNYTVVITNVDPPGLKIFSKSSLYAPVGFPSVREWKGPSDLLPNET